jgi:hypothetical protein
MNRIIPGRQIMKKLSLILLVVLAGFQSLNAATKPSRIALVIGNSDYTVGKLKNPVNDALLMASTLASKGFQVTTLKNATRRQMKEGIHKFTSSLDEQSVGLLYYAGHGIELEGNNYLIPVDAEIAGEGDVEYESINAGRILNGLKRANNGLNMVILDACRNNPYARNFRSSTRGLSRMQPTSGSLILYATEPGSVAADGSGDNGVFTTHLVNAINQKGYNIEKVFKVTARNVSKATAKRQIPYIEGVVLGEFYFNDTAVAGETQVVDQPAAQNFEFIYWQSVQNITSLAAYEAYLSQYPNGVFAALAKVEINRLNSLNSQAITKLDEQPVKDQPGLGPDITTGIYVSEIRGGPSWSFWRRNPKFTFEQRGYDIIGTDVSKNRSKIYGIRNGDTINFKYWGWNRLILGKWKINPDGTSLEGTWEIESGYGSWNLTRIP